MTVYEMTRMALAEAAPARVLAAYDALPPNRLGHPMIGLLGFLAPSDLAAVLKAADFAHRRAGTDGWDHDVNLACVRRIARTGGWRTPAGHARALPAISAYQAAIRADLEAAS